MATTPISPLPAVFPVRDPFKVSFQDATALASDNDEPTELEVLVQVEDAQGSDIYRTVGEMINPYGADDTAAVLIHRALMGALKASPPSLTAVGLIPFTGICKKYRLQARDIVGGVAMGTFAISDPAHAWLAGQSYTDHGYDLSEGRAYKFLYTQDDPKYFHPNQRFHFQFLTFIAGEDISLLIQAHYTDNTTEDFSTPLGDLTAFTGYAINVPKPVWTKPLEKFIVTLTGFFASSEAINCYFRKASQYAQEVFYLNSHGGYENFVFTGKSEYTNTVSGEVFESQVYPGDAADPGNYQSFNQKSFDGVILRSGWLRYADLLALKDMVLRNEVYLVEGTKLRKLIIANATYPTRKDGEFLYSVEIQGRFGFDNTALSRA